jgi:hypothetical protein
MRVNKAKRRWIRWCRYVDKTQTVAANKAYAGTHLGQALAYESYMYANRWAPKGVRVVWYPAWGSVRRG